MLCSHWRNLRQVHQQHCLFERYISISLPCLGFLFSNVWNSRGFSNAQFGNAQKENVNEDRSKNTHTAYCLGNWYVRDLCSPGWS